MEAVRKEKWLLVFMAGLVLLAIGASYIAGQSMFAVLKRTGEPGMSVMVDAGTLCAYTDVVAKCSRGVPDVVLETGRDSYVLNATRLDARSLCSRILAEKAAKPLSNGLSVSCIGGGAPVVILSRDSSRDTMVGLTVIGLGAIVAAVGGLRASGRSSR